MTCSPDRGNKDQQTSRKIMDRLQHTFPGIYTFCQLQTELYQLNLCEESLQLCHIAQCSIFSLVLTPHDQQVSTFPNKKEAARLQLTLSCLCWSSQLRPNHSHVRPWLLWQTTTHVVGCLASHHYKPQASLAFSNFRFNANSTKQYYFFFIQLAVWNVGI